MLRPVETSVVDLDRSDERPLTVGVGRVLSPELGDDVRPVLPHPQSIADEVGRRLGLGLFPTPLHILGLLLLPCLTSLGTDLAGFDLGVFTVPPVAVLTLDHSASKSASTNHGLSRRTWTRPRSRVKMIASSCSSVYCLSSGVSSQRPCIASWRSVASWRRGADRRSIRIFNSSPSHAPLAPAAAAADSASLSAHIRTVNGPTLSFLPSSFTRSAFHGSPPSARRTPPCIEASLRAGSSTS